MSTSKRHLLLTLLVVTTTSFAQTEQNSEKNSENSIDLTRGKMYSQLLNFRYEPSQRDPFISSLVVSPFVTENDLTDTIGVDQEKIKQSIGMVTNFLEGKIKLRGIVFGKIGTNYAVAYGDGEKDQIIHPGKYLSLNTEKKDQELIETALRLAAEGGLIIKLPIYKSFLLVKVLKIQNNTVIFENPCDKTIITIAYKKDMDLPKIPSPADEKQLQKGIK